MNSTLFKFRSRDSQGIYEKMLNVFSYGGNEISSEAIRIAMIKKINSEGWQGFRETGNLYSLLVGI